MHELNPNQLLDLEHPLQEEEFLPGRSRWARLGGIALVGIFSAALLAAATLKYNVTVKVPATIRPTGELRLAQPGVEGTVKQISVKENQVVKQGDPIAYLDDSRGQTRQSQLQISNQQTELQLTQVMSQMAAIRSQIAAESQLIRGNLGSSKATLSGERSKYRERQANTQAELQAAQNDLAIARAQWARVINNNELKANEQEAQANLEAARGQWLRLVNDNELRANEQEARANLEAARAQWEQLGRENQANLQEAQANLDLAKIQLTRWRRLRSAGAISQNQYDEKVRAVKVAEAQLKQTQAANKKEYEIRKQALETAKADLLQTQAANKKEYDIRKQALGTTKAKLLQTQAANKKEYDARKQALETAKAKFLQAQAAVNSNDADVRVAATQLEQVQPQGQATIAGLNNQLETLNQRSAELRSQLNRGQKELQQLQAELKGSVVRAPVTGTVLQLSLRNQGQVVRPGEPIAYIAPQGARLEIKARIPAQEINKVKVGQAVQMQVSACPYPDYGTLKGKVKTVAPDALPATDNQNQSSPTTPPPNSFEVTIEPETSFVGDSDRQCQLQTGMEGKADIITKEETVLTFVLRKARLLTDT
ncbi:MAG: HlyD family efflux transporter periplasmic adaptor subunit [Cyanosarcina radialis HA8281-LM2]|jgi:multidrug efflux pump subunit AcrA (membrane-fusion protein)|nr:HlyD family efflux transporter periplasmic adaptor subunit [Cyanosarcina radialis HA8281-LM2]